ncbi:hypothetical protein ACSNOI_12645 [Actinomadura kijaniata]
MAAAMLSTVGQDVEQLLADGKLDRHPDGGVTAASVQMRLCDQTR